MPGIRPLRRRAQLATLGLLAVVLADVAIVWTDLRMIEVVSELVDDGIVQIVPLGALEEHEDAERDQLVALIAYFAALAVAATLFIRWFHAAYANLKSLGQTNLRYGPGWAIGSWFVPFLNLWRPKQIANDVWRGSTPDAATYTSSAWPTQPIPALLTAWWAAWIVANFLSNAVGRAAWTADTAENVRSAARFEIFATSVDIGAAALAIAVVWKLTARQEARTERVTASSHPSAATDHR